MVAEAAVVGSEPAAPASVDGAAARASGVPVPPVPVPPVRVLVRVSVPARASASASAHAYIRARASANIYACQKRASACRPSSRRARRRSPWQHHLTTWPA